MAGRVDELLRVEDEYESSSELAMLVYEKAQVSGWDSLTDVEEALLLVHIIAMDVSNGGFTQFFATDDGARTAATLDAFKRIGAKRAAKMLGELARAFPGGMPSSDDDERSNQLEALDDAWREREEALSSEFWGYSYEVRRQSVEYAKKHRTRLFEGR